MKKLLTLMMVIAFAFAFTACGGGGGGSGDAAGDSDGDAAASTEGTQSSGAKIKIVMANGLGETNPSHLVMVAFKEYLEANSDDFEVEIYPLGQLGSEREQIESAQDGSIQMTAASTSPYTGFVKDASIFDMPFAIENYDQLVAVLADPDFVAAIDESFSAVGLKIGVMGNSAFRALESRKPIRHIEDFKGLNMRVMENENHINTFKALGCVTTAVPWSELYTALQQGLVDAHDSSFTMTVTNNLQEQTPYATSIYHLMGVIMYTMNLEWFNNLTPDQQNIIMESWKYAESTRPNADQNEKNMLQIMIDENGIEAFDFTAEDIEKGKELCQPVWEAVKEQVTPRVYDAYQAAIERAS
ncbi:MAG: TRAP transporter substrate-binding protein [Clostridiales Family XIII bacterium]|jgi:TRAP-type C4-dicarboxylate transport system substrate-binding protein|nr:TRAP transporter substrate-binding protein [Clostridiales Family XIII bacterium]